MVRTRKSFLKLDPTKRPRMWAHGGSAKDIQRFRKQQQLAEQSKLGIRVMKRPKRRNADKNAESEIRKTQATTDLLIPKASFQKLVKEIATRLNGTGYRFQKSAILALQEATEAYLVQWFQDAKECQRHANRRTMMAEDMKLVKILRPLR